MKAIIVCGLCSKPKKYSDSYALKVLDYKDLKPVENAKGKTEWVADIKKIRACRTCTKRIGYKIKVKKPYDKKN